MYYPKCFVSRGSASTKPDDGSLCVTKDVSFELDLTSSLVLVVGIDAKSLEETELDS